MKAFATSLALALHLANALNLPAANPDLRVTEVQSSPAANASVPTADWWELTSFEAGPVSLAGYRFNDSSGGLSDPFVIAAQVLIQPGESIVLVEELTANQFKNWWGSANLPPSIQILTYQGSGLGFGAGGDAVNLWNNTTTDPLDLVDSAAFGQATAGVTFNYNPVAGTFGQLSQLGVNGVFKAAGGNDIGSPGRIAAPVQRPTLTGTILGDQLQIRFLAEDGRKYSLETRLAPDAGPWLPAGQTLTPTESGPAFFNVDLAPGEHYFRVAAE